MKSEVRLSKGQVVFVKKELYLRVPQYLVDNDKCRKLRKLLYILQNDRCFISHHFAGFTTQGLISKSRLDHDHNRLLYRAILCPGCNHKLAKYDNFEILGYPRIPDARFIKYLSLDWETIIPEDLFLFTNEESKTWERDFMFHYSELAILNGLIKLIPKEYVCSKNHNEVKPVENQVYAKITLRDPSDTRPRRILEFMDENNKNEY